MERQFDEELKKLKEKLMQMASLAEESISLAVKSLKEREAGIADREREVKAREVESAAEQKSFADMRLSFSRARDEVEQREQELQNLEDKLEAEGPLGEEDAKEILANTAEALAAAHDLHFVHRDVRTAIVLCDREGGRSLLSDFGLAGIRPEAQDADARITRGFR